MRRSGRLSVIAGLLWLPQAALVALTLGALLQPENTTMPLLAAALGFVAIGALRAALTHQAGRLALDAAQTCTHAERTALIARETHRTAQDPARRPAAATATLAAEKLSHLLLFLTRYAPARARVMVLPVVILAISAYFSWAVALVLLLAGPLIPVFMALVGMAAKQASERQMKELSDMNVLLMERLVALVDIRLLGAQERSVDQFHDAADSLRQRTMDVLRIAFLSSTVLELFAAIGVAMVAIYVGFALLGELGFGAYTTPLTPSEGIFLLLLAPEYFQPLRDLAAAWHDKADAEAVAQELAELEAAQATSFVGQGIADSTVLNGVLTTRALAYDVGNGRQILYPDLTATPGQLITLSGASGSGKTTFLRLLAGLERPTGGQIMIGATFVDDTNADCWRRSLGWMPQTPKFLSGSLLSNLYVSQGRNPRPLDEALELAHALEIVAALPKGLQTQLGENGVGLSGGEARRIMLARAALGRPSVLLVDEPTADLDSTTAQQVMDGLARLRAEGCTIIAATHDPALIDRADHVVTLDQAKAA